MLPNNSKVQITTLALALGAILSVLPLSSLAASTEGQILIDENSATQSSNNGTPDAELLPRFSHSISAVVTAPDGKAVRFVLGSCDSLLGSCLSINSGDQMTVFHSWSQQSSNGCAPSKKDVTIELEGSRYILHDVIPQNMRIDSAGNAPSRIYEYKIGSIEAFRN